MSVPNQGEAYTGPEVTRALRAMDAEAMTLDGTILVAEDFDPSKATDAALFAHEQYHVEHGRDGQLSHAVHDAEEVAARAVEAMVLHRMAGGYDAGYQPGAGSGSTPGAGKTPDNEGRGSSESNSGASNQAESVDAGPDAVRGYWLLRHQGFSHTDVVDKLARDVVSAIEDAGQSGLARTGDLKGSI